MVSGSLRISRADGDRRVPLHLALAGRLSPAAGRWPSLYLSLCQAGS